jgi:hypothetical protein
MTSQMKRAIDVLDMLSAADLKTADDAALHQFRDLALSWADQAVKALADRQRTRTK